MRKWEGLWTALFTAVITFVGSVASANTNVIEAYGDSLTAGFLAETNLTAPPPLTAISDFISAMALFKITANPKSLSRLHHPELAWPHQLSSLLQEKSGDTFEVRNFAVTGAGVSDLITQLNRAGAESRSTRAFFFVGHNDVCGRPVSVEDLGQRYAYYVETAARTWDSQHQNATLYFMPVGDASEAYRLLTGVVWFQGQHARYTCEDSWDRWFPYCRAHRVLRRDGAGKVQEFLTPRVDRMNEVLAKVADEWSKKSERGNHFYFLRDLEHPVLQKEYFAVDCYHLSATGQDALAKILLRQM